jgi:hypothetical protein
MKHLIICSKRINLNFSEKTICILKKIYIFALRFGKNYVRNRIVRSGKKRVH